MEAQGGTLALLVEREEARRRVGAFLGAEPDDLAFVRNATTGVIMAFTHGRSAWKLTNTATGEVFRTIDVAGQTGLNRVQWDLRGNPPAGAQNQAVGRGGGRGGFAGPEAEAGVYRVTLTVNGQNAGSETLRVLEDVWMR